MADTTCRLQLFRKAAVEVILQVRAWINKQTPKWLESGESECERMYLPELGIGLDQIIVNADECECCWFPERSLDIIFLMFGNLGSLNALVMYA